VYGGSDFAGGVSDSLYGVTAYSYNSDYSGNSAQKAWFFFDSEVVCLGSGIRAAPSAADFDINTTVNQCLLSGDALISANGGVTVLPRGGFTYPEAPDWVLHGGIGYVFPMGGEIGVSAEARTGNWHDINISQPDEKVTKDVFTLWLNHGKNPADARYAYIVVPCKHSAREMEDYHRKNPVAIWENSGAVQAVYHKELDVLGIVFYEAGVFEHDGVKVSADRSCIIMITGVKTPSPVQHISDPAYAPPKVTLKVDS
jgi:chondroitin AC lyase